MAYSERVKTREFNRIFLLNPSNREFAEGKAPYNTSASSRHSALFSRWTQIVFAAGLLWSLAAGGMYFYQSHQRESQSHIPTALLIVGPVILLCAGVLALVAFGMRTQVLRQDRLKRYGIVLDAELVKAALILDDESPHNLSCQFRFVSPQGLSLARKASAYRKGINKNNLPAPGTPLLVLYADDKCFEVL